MKKLILFFTLIQAFNIYAQDYLAAAKKDREWGYINSYGNWVIEPKFQEAGDFSEGLARVRYKGLVGFIDKTGNWVIKPAYEKAEDFKNGIATVLGNGWEFIDKKGKILSKDTYPYMDDAFSHGYIRVKKNLAWKFIDSVGNELKTVDFLGCEPFKEGFARVEINQKWGFINTSGKLVIVPIYNSVSDFSNGLARVLYEGKFGYIDQKGNLKIENKFNEAKDFSNGLARVFINGCWNFINTEGKIVIQLDEKVDQVNDFSNGLARIQQGECGYINTKGQIIIESKYVVAKDFKYGVAVVRDRGDFALIDQSGNLLTQPDFAKIDIDNYGLVRVKTLKDRWGYMSNKGKWIINPEFIELRMFQKVE